MTLRQNLIVLTLASLIPAFLIAAAGLWAFERGTQRVVETGLLHNARALSLAVDGYVEASISALEVLARADSLRAGDFAAFHAAALDVLATARNWENIVLFDADARQVVNLRLPFGRPLPANVSRPHVVAAVTSQRPVTSNIFEGLVSKQKLVSVVVPVDIPRLGPHGLAAALRQDALSELLSRQRIPADSITALLDRNKIIIARTRARETFVGQRATADLVAETEARAEGAFIAWTKEGQRVYAAFHRSEMTGWTIALGIPLTALQQPSQSARNLLLAGGGVIMLAGIGIALLTSRRIASSILSLRGAADDLARDIEPRVSAALPEVRRVAEALADAHARRKVVEDEVQRRRRIADELADVGRRLSQSLEPEEVGRLIVEALVRLLDVRMARLHRVDPASRDLVFVAGAGEQVESSPRLRSGTGVMGLAIHARHPVATNDVLNDPRIELDPEVRSRIERSGYQAVVSVPLVLGEEAVGAIALGAEAGRTFSEEEIEIVGRFADQAATALRNAGLFRELREAHDRLAAAEGQLVQSQKMEAVGRLAGGIAHDFNNLLMVIRGRTDLLLRDVPPAAPPYRSLRLIRDTATRAAALTQQLLAFSRRQLLQPETVDLSTVVVGMAPMLRPMIGEDVEFSIHPADGPVWVFADRSKLEQVILNLVVNARDAMPRGGQLTMEVQSVELDDAFVQQHVGSNRGPHALLRVSDTGTGMDDATKARIFDPFFTTKVPGRGTGLGLSTVYGVVKQHNGYIAVDTGPARGAAFSIYLPRTGPEVPREPAERPVFVMQGSTTETLLLVEDDDEVRALAREILELHGYTVRDAAGGQEAMRLVEGSDEEFAVLLTDVVMPGMSGPELADRVGTLRPGIKVLYMSGYTDDAVARHGLLDAAVFLEKPFSADELLRKVRGVIDAG